MICVKINDDIKIDIYGYINSTDFTWLIYPTDSTEMLDILEDITKFFSSYERFNMSYMNYSSVIIKRLCNTTKTLSFNEIYNHFKRLFDINILYIKCTNKGLPLPLYNMRIQNVFHNITQWTQDQVLQFADLIINYVSSCITYGMPVTLSWNNNLNGFRNALCFYSNKTILNYFDDKVQQLWT